MIDLAELLDALIAEVDALDARMAEIQSRLRRMSQPDPEVSEKPSEPNQPPESEVT